MKFTVCIPAVRSTTLTAIKSIQSQTWSDWELLVVGQGSDRSVRAVVEATGKEARLRYVHAKERGTSRARNAGILAAKGEVVAFIDDDCEAREDWLETMAEYFMTFPDIGLVGGALVKPKKSGLGPAVCPTIMPNEALYDSKAMPLQVPPGWNWIGGNVGIRRSVIEKEGLFDENLGPGSDFPCAEDTDYKLRLEGLGSKMLSSPRVVVYHTHGYRYGLKAMRKNAYNYAYGNGGLAGKLTLMGDPRGKEWKQHIKQQSLFGWLRPFRPHRLLIGLMRWENYQAAYNYCLREYEIKNRMLVKKASQTWSSLLQG